MKLNEIVFSDRTINYKTERSIYRINSTIYNNTTLKNSIWVVLNENQLFPYFFFFLLYTTHSVEFRIYFYFLSTVANAQLELGIQNRNPRFHSLSPLDTPLLGQSYLLAVLRHRALRPLRKCPSHFTRMSQPYSASAIDGSNPAVTWRSPEGVEGALIRALNLS